MATNADNIGSLGDRADFGEWITDVERARTDRRDAGQPKAGGIGLHLEPFQRRIAKAAAGAEREFVCLIPRAAPRGTPPRETDETPRTPHARFPRVSEDTL